MDVEQVPREGPARDAAVQRVHARRCGACLEQLTQRYEFNGLDIPSKGLFRRLVAEAVEEDRIFVIATHQVRDVEALVDRLLVLHDGRVLFDGGVSELSGSIRISVGTGRPDDNGKGLLYAEPTVGGFASVWKDANAGDGHLDLEILFKAVITRPDEFAALSAKRDQA